MNNCPKCGSRNPANTKLCLHCNAVLPRTQTTTHKAQGNPISLTTIMLILIPLLAIGGFFLISTLKKPVSFDDVQFQLTDLVCITDANANQESSYRAQGYQNCDQQRRNQCPPQTLHCLSKVIKSTDAP